MKKVVIYSIPFGFGPTSKAITIANRLKSFHEVFLLSFGHTIQLLKNSINDVPIFDCKTREVDKWKNLNFYDCDIFICIMDLQVLNNFKIIYPKIKNIFIDSLSWWREFAQINDSENIDYYIAQYFPGVPKLTNTLDNSRFYVVSPIMEPFNDVSERFDQLPKILVHYGGISSPIIDSLDYLPFLIKTTEMLIQALTKLGKCNLVFTGNLNAMEILRSYFRNNENTSFSCLPHHEFQKRMSESDYFITTPGIEATYESFSLKKPAIFLPPLNSTQLGQFIRFLESSLPVLIDKASLCTLHDIARVKVPYQTQTLELCNFANKLAGRDDFKDTFEVIMNNLNESSFARKELINKQIKFVPNDLPDGLSLIETLIAL